MYDAISREEVISFLKLYGCNATSYLTLQEGMSYHYFQNAGYIAYKRIRNKVFALGDPVCSPGHYQEITDRFLYNYPSARFIQVSAEFRDILVNEFGYYGTAMGVETLLPGSWNLTGRKKQNIRTAINTVRKEDILVKENNQEVNYSGLMDNWLRTRKVKSKEICFLVRPSKMHSPQTRRFFAYKEDRLMGMMFFDPLYKDGCVFGYIPNICMSSTEFKQGIYYALAFQGFTSFSRERERERKAGCQCSISACPLSSRLRSVRRKAPGCG
jgi:lysylphosphatidylglycerol synthetase-like protein (DUF2156 family)